MNLLKSLSTPVLLGRLLHTLTRLAKAQERLAKATEQQVQIEALRAGIRPSLLDEAIAAGDEEGEFALSELSPQEEARLRELEREADTRGIALPDDGDMEETLYPGGDGMDRKRSMGEILARMMGRKSDE